MEHVLVDSGACASVVEKDTLNQALSMLSTSHVEDARQRQMSHRFGNYEEVQTSLFGVVMPFEVKNDDKENQIGFKVHFDRIKEDLNFLLGLPTMTSIETTTNLKYMNLSLHLEGKYCSLHIDRDKTHVYLPFEAKRMIPNWGGKIDS